MGRLRAKLVEQFGRGREGDGSGGEGGSGGGTTILTPKNCQSVEFFFKGEKVAKAVGRVAELARGEAVAHQGGWVPVQGVLKCL